MIVLVDLEMPIYYLTPLYLWARSANSALLSFLKAKEVTTVVVLVLSATYQLQAPFAGSVRVEPETFEEVLNDIQRQQREH
jgi:hypothetical protein